MYKAAYFCAGCKAELTTKERMHNRGVCPYCGTVSPGTIVATEKHAVWVDDPEPKMSFLARFFK